MTPPAPTAAAPLAGQGGGARAWLSEHRVQAYVYTVTAVAAVLVASSGAVAAQQQYAVLPVLLATMLCLFADRPLLDIRFGHNQESFTWAELCVVIGLFLVPLPLLTCLAFAAVLVFHLAHRRAMFKAGFNAAVFSIGVVLAGAAANGAGLTAGDTVDARDAAALTLAALVFFLWNSFAVTTVVAMSEGMRVRDVYRKGLLLRLLICVCNSAVGVGILAMWAWSRPSVLVLPPLLLLLYAAYRGYLQAMQERDAWQQLESASRELNALDEWQVASAALRHARTMFRAEAVELVISDLDARGARTYFINEAGDVQVEAVDNLPRESELTFVQIESGRSSRPVTCLVVPLEGPHGRLGVLRLVFGGPVRLTERERQVLSTFAHTVGTTMLNATLHGDVLAQARQHAHEASHDALTGLANRTLLAERTKVALAAGAGSTAMLLLDLDHFKEINDTLGHSAGDLLLQEVARRLREAVRDGDTVARLGGDEFAVLLSGLSSPDDATPVAEELLRLLSEPVEFEGLRLSIEGSLGVACHPEDADTPDELLRRADVAMYQAKAERGSWLRYNSRRDDSSVHRLALVAELRRALEQDELVVHYQPQLDLETGIIVGAEALVRWQHPTRGLLAPIEFVGVAEQSGLVRPFTMRVLDQAVGECARWQRAGRPVSVAVNLSARSLLDRELPNDVAAVLQRHGLPADLLVLEITETNAASELEVVEDVLWRLRQLGVEISVDDFGTGYSSLAFLQRTAVNELKVDRSFVTNMLESDNDVALVRATISLAHSLGARAVAEGVETAELAEALKALDCDQAQGYWLSRPIPAADLRSMLQIPDPAPRMPLPRDEAPVRHLKAVGFA